MNAWQAGATGIYVYNFNPPKRDVRLSEIGDLAVMKGKDKVYAVDYIIPETFEGDLRPGLVVPDRLPIKIVRDEPITARLPVGENIAANAPADKAAHARLRLRVSPLAKGDKVAVKLNGQPLGDTVAPVALADRPAAVWIEYEPDPGLIRAGDNSVEILLSSVRKPAAPRELDHLELVVRYR